MTAPERARSHRLRYIALATALTITTDLAAHLATGGDGCLDLLVCVTKALMHGLLALSDRSARDQRESPDAPE